MKVRDFNIERKGKYYYRGVWDENIFQKSIAIVGSRRMTKYGKDVIDKFVSAFVAEGVSTISGFMYGVDTEVHQKTVDYGGRTVAVFGCGLDVIYPPENEKLYLQILENKGLVISEYDKDAKPHLWKFPQRNKIVAKLSSLGVLVIEAGDKSGSLITADLARKMGKKVFAVPGPINSSTSFGCNELIKSGNAFMATDASDILKIRSHFAHSASLRATRDEPELDRLEGKIYKALQIEPLDADEIAAQIGEDIVSIGSTISLMGIKGIVSESGGKYYIVQ